MRRPRRNHTAAIKAKVALAALKGDKMLAELVEKYNVHGSQVMQWKTQLLEGALAGRLHISTLMAKMGITALYRQPNTSRRHPGHKVYPYLLRHMAIERANHVWAMDITYLPSATDDLYFRRGIANILDMS